MSDVDCGVRIHPDLLTVKLCETKRAGAGRLGFSSRADALNFTA
jgi:hypothetical protein